MRLDFLFSERPPESLRCEALVFFVFNGRPLSNGPLARLDRRSGGLLGRLRKAGFWTAALEEDLLLACPSGVRARKVLLCGLGPSAECSEACISEQVERVGGVLARLRVRDLAVHIPAPYRKEQDYPLHLEQWARLLAASFLRIKDKAPDYALRVVFCMSPRCFDRLSTAAGRLRDAFGPGLDVSVVIDLNGRGSA
jgi:hypothetical protein